MAVLGSHHFPLLGDFDPAGGSGKRLGHDGPMAQSPASVNRAPLAMEQNQMAAMAMGRVGQPSLHLIERPVGGQITAVLVGIGVAEHHLLAEIAGR